MGLYGLFYGKVELFSFYVINGTFGKKITEHKICVLIFSAPLIWNSSHPKKNLARYCHKHT